MDEYEQRQRDAARQERAKELQERMARQLELDAAHVVADPAALRVILAFLDAAGYYHDTSTDDPHTMIVRTAKRSAAVSMMDILQRGDYTVHAKLMAAAERTRQEYELLYKEGTDHDAN